MIELPTDANPCVVVEGDCLSVLRALPDGCVDAVITDPPYGVRFQSAWRTESERFDEIANDDAPFVWWLRDAARLVRPGGCLLCFCSWDIAEAFRLAIGWSGLKVGAQLVWDRVVHGLGDLKGRPAPQHDIIWFAVNGRYQFHDRRPKSVCRSQRLGGEELTHPNQKPIGLMRQLVCDYVPPGGTILDPFLGSGTTAVAAVAESRMCIGVELDSEYAAMARARVAKALGRNKDSLLSVLGDQPDLFGDAP